MGDLSCGGEGEGEKKKEAGDGRQGQRGSR